MSTINVDVLIIGAGVSGIGIACHLTKNCPDKSFLILERRQAIGGTWDLFRYPGIRSDSDMYTFGYRFRPWTEGKTLADGPSIKRYVTETANAYGVDKRIRFGNKVVRANWSSQQRHWSVDVLNEASGETESYSCNFLVGCTGYYNYDAGYQPDFPGKESFRGTIVHPQHWPENLDYQGKRVVVIGSGATAVTLVPAMADKAGHVTMLQRSPTYMLPLPVIDPIAKQMQRFMSNKWVYRLTRSRNIATARLIYNTARSRPKVMRRFLQNLVRKQLNGAADMRHFTPNYDPWDERLCVVADGDLFTAIKSGDASIVTDHIETFTPTGIKLKSGQTLAADIIITATGLDLQMLSSAEILVDEQPVAISDKLIYKNALVEGVPNAAIVFGYTNISWTLKVDIVADYLCRLLKHMDKKGYRQVVPIDNENSRTNDTVMGSLSAGYVRRAADKLPRQGSKGPWVVTQDYAQDAKILREAPIEDGYLQFDGVQSQTERCLNKGLWGSIRAVLTSQ